MYLIESAQRDFARQVPPTLWGAGGINYTPTDKEGFEPPIRFQRALKPSNHIFQDWPRESRRHRAQPRVRDGLMGALTVLSGMAAAAAGLSTTSAKSDWLANLIPGVVVVPAGVLAVNRAQENHCTYCYAG